MRRGTLAVLAALGMTALMAGGCANKEQVRSEEPVVKTDTTRTETAKPEAQKPVETAPVAPQPVAEAPKPAESEVAGKPAAEAALETIYFDFDKSDLSQSARDTLGRNAEVLLKSKPNAKARIEGHCDERGSAEYNLALGERRAKSSMQYLVTLGVQPERLSVISYGKEKPAVEGHDDTAWAKNRRVEFIIVK
ncbi:peptidoglycan-associated lipoprotein Pal [Geobacter sp. SVR]|uniref:peptidoglycan-associated lipoprotein Pal n=1 Tax=Geobacter sp. SVR TaxID=2495594 RepID=UPI00143EFA1D|nr:peptidoglycan-associated lipoprotein Pal [Geobacter sp. SVR]BCS56079.1 peptidoglycan-associated lipoprotein [Geobacter sp. SVR]GCF84842.1 peptidoglycan-associated lipoprotein [Geobacter sp. SVR]